MEVSPNLKHKCHKFIMLYILYSQISGLVSITNQKQIQYFFFLISIFLSFCTIMAEKKWKIFKVISEEFNQYTPTTILFLSILPNLSIRIQNCLTPSSFLSSLLCFFFPLNSFSKTLIFIFFFCFGYNYSHLLLRFVTFFHV